MNKSLICYFSATGATKRMAEELSKIINADLFEIKPVKEYTSEDLDWTNEESRTAIEKNDESIRTEIKNKVNNINEYSKIIIGFPVWWYKEPSIIDTFIEENDLSNKEIYVYVTSGGSAVDGSFNHLKEKYGNLNFISGKTLNSINKNEIIDWIK